MATRAAMAAIPSGLRKVYRRFEHWRSAHTGRLPIPEHVWASAAEVAKEHGCFRTAQCLRLEYSKLKERMQSTTPVRRTTARRTRSALPAFLELVAPQAVGLSECLIELEGPRGKMRIQWKGTTAPDLSGLSRVFWEPTR